jgi:hypothetical protein
VDTVEVRLVEDSLPSSAVLSNATDFLSEHNPNYDVSWSEVAHQVPEANDEAAQSGAAAELK